MPSCCSSPIAISPATRTRSCRISASAGRIIEFLHFVTRHSGLRVADLLDVLKITKQSLGRVLKQLIDKGYIVQRAGSVDRRERLLYPTAAGRALTKRLAAPQLIRLAEALQAAGPGADLIVRRFLQAMINAEERPKVSSIMSSLPAPAQGDGNAEAS